jgi:hypothetical protein
VHYFACQSLSSDSLIREIGYEYPRRKIYSLTHYGALDCEFEHNLGTVLPPTALGRH